eukprot:CAMPEP_0184499130 /NCGR_PEP_ID=MMETSP0113_2-20130426/40706_1 /TAXON_ID=91329 /ORGANISM="Norrisiella sphaerica, Strain BC52" /LENGTH=189 /DNA_ID=CAMNT_0026886925 /DNA_START=828 /DNA_END=1398 /DNA_ORIENTATION=+
MGEAATGEKSRGEGALDGEIVCTQSVWEGWRVLELSAEGEWSGIELGNFGTSVPAAGTDSVEPRMEMGKAWDLSVAATLDEEGRWAGMARKLASHARLRLGKQCLDTSCTAEAFRPWTSFHVPPLTVLFQMNQKLHEGEREFSVVRLTRQDSLLDAPSAHPFPKERRQGKEKRTIVASDLSFLPLPLNK